MFLCFRTGMLSNLTAPCNENCNCLRSSYLPVCGTDEVQYFSPCYAGCSSVSNQNSGQVISCTKNAKFPMCLWGLKVLMKIMFCSDNICNYRLNLIHTKGVERGLNLLLPVLWSALTTSLLSWCWWHLSLKKPCEICSWIFQWWVEFDSERERLCADCVIQFVVNTVTLIWNLVWGVPQGSMLSPFIFI